MSDRSYSPELFFSENSPYARICRMALRERDLSAQIKETVTALRDPQAVVLPHNPTGRVPALLLSDGTTLTETTLILQWLDQQGTRSAMMPADPKGIAAYGRVLGLLDGIAVWNRELRRPENERSPSVLKLEAVRADRIADALERDVAGGAYAKIDMGALALLAVLGYAERRHRSWSWRSGHAALEQWFDTCSDRPSFKETIPPLQA
ncbi:MAG: glutathione S-transferase family protein [Orrella sp.]|jgi:glutathione S-transferase|uniref:glutathione S-transferase family protein n=1 Tax=Orrella sp. TaxID=1921583 RepID=UPI003BDDAA86